MTRSLATAVLLSALCLAACGDPARTPAAGRRSPAPAASETTQDTEGIFEANATVLEDDKGNVNLCLGGIAMSLPPQCGNVPVTNWDWAQVDGEEKAAGVTWGGDYHVVGRFDGETFTLTERPGPPAKHLEGEDHFSAEPACEEPAEGWITEGAVDQQTAGNALSLIRREPEYAAGWISQLEPPGEFEDTGPVVLNVGVTGRLEEHEATLRRHWDGSLCVVRYQRSLDDLSQVRADVEAMINEMSVQPLWSDLDEIRGVINEHVVYIDEDDRRQIEQRFGTETVNITTALRPVRG